MTSLVLRAAGPFQAWGVRGAFGHRDTLPHPSKAGIVGLLAAALGRDRTDPIDDLASVTVHVRLDRPGIPLTDFRTVGGGTHHLTPRDQLVVSETERRSLAKAAEKHGTSRHVHRSFAWAVGRSTERTPAGVLVSGTRMKNNMPTPVVTRRDLLADAAFLVTVTHPDTNLISGLADALNAPRRLLWLGRKSCPPAHPLFLGVAHEPADTIIETWPSQNPAHTTATQVEAVIEVPHGTPGARTVTDQPVSFDPTHRSHTVRHVISRHLTIPPYKDPNDAP